MSGSVSRAQGRLTYAPGLRLGSAYPVVMQAGQPLVPGMVTPPVSAPMPVAAVPSVPASGQPAGVMVGARRVGNDSENNSAGGDYGNSYGGPGPSGAPTTGSFLSDLAAFGQVAGPAALGIAGGPMGMMGVAGGLMAAGLMNAVGMPEMASQFARSAGLRGEAVEAAPVSEWGNPAMGATTTGNISGGSPGGDLASPGMESSLDATALSGSQAAQDQAALDAGLGNFGSGDMGNLGGADYGGGNFGDGANSAGGGLNDGGGFGDSGGGYGGDTAGMGSSESGVGWMRGGYTGPGGAAEPAGTVHKGEVVIPSSQVARYGLDPLLMLARGQVNPSRLSMLLRG